MQSVVEQFRYRVQTCASKRKLAKVSGVSLATIRKFSNSDHDVSGATLERLQEALGLEVVLYGGESETVSDR